MRPPFTDSVVLVTSGKPENEGFGTGFIIHQDGDATYLLTCAHVVRDVGGAAHVRVGVSTATVVASRGGERGPDLAVLRVEGLGDKRALSLRVCGASGKKFTTAGFILLKPEHLINSLRGTLGEEVGLEYRDQAGRFRAWFLQLEGDSALQQGLSGSPVLDDSGAVVGVVSHRVGQGKKGIAVSIEALAEVWRDMPDCLLGKVQTVVNRPDRIVQTDPLMNLKNEIAVFEQIAKGEDAETRLILVHGESGTGKTRLLTEYERIARATQLHVFLIPLGPQISAEGCLYEFVNHLDPRHFKAYDDFLTAGRPEPFTRVKEEEWHRNLTRKFLNDLSEHPSLPRLAVFFDQYQKADQTFKDWLNRYLLPGFRTRASVVVVVAGHERVEHDPAIRGQCSFELGGLEIKHFYEYAAHFGMEESADFPIKKFHELLGGRPKNFVEYVKAQAARKRTNE